ncbi:helix-turn-helix domain-containing protein [Streptomyces lydicamycinicus]|uniref:helix-turn-helix domain-containing protein n=1 Tax=Streptomyces lydicamycinicus TaxID=1546107 RepID=UPI0020350AB0|nr:helix-turn-helix transcriptional regulator [Streptomyces lydicamycinicus]USA01676.1 helix-turn-helix domain-containing protein [Streptomyces lydicamycinicus]
MSGSGGEPRGGVECSRLAAGLRELRARTGLSLAALAARTPYSKSSWERYLNGKKLPPRDAVEALCRLAGEPAGRLVALWELADAAWSGRGRSGAAQVRDGGVRRPTGRRGQVRRVRPRLRRPGPRWTARPRPGGRRRRPGGWRAWWPAPGPAEWRSSRRWPSGRRSARPAR